MQQRVPPYRPPARRIQPPARYAIAFILLFFGGVLVVLFLQSPLGEVRDIHVTGNRMVSDREVTDRAGVKPGDSFFRWDADHARRRLESMPEVDRVEVIKSFPGSVHFRVKEAQRVAFRMEGDEIYPVLADGSVLRKRPWEGSVDRPVLRGWGRSFADSGLIRGLAQTPRPILADISEIRPGKDHTYPDLVKVYTRQGHLIRVRSRDFDKKIKLYPSFRNHPPGTLHLLESTWFTPKNDTEN